MLVLVYPLRKQTIRCPYNEVNVIELNTSKTDFFNEESSKHLYSDNYKCLDDASLKKSVLDMFDSITISEEECKYIERVYSKPEGKFPLVRAKMRTCNCVMFS